LPCYAAAGERVRLYNSQRDTSHGGVKFHLLFSVSALFANINKQPTMVVEPRFTLRAAESPAEILPLAANCLETAFENVLNQAQVSGKVFSPQNWLKSGASVQGQQLVAGTIAGMLPSLPTGKALLQALSVPAQALISRWSAD
jgi:hypothetical protein